MSKQSSPPDAPSSHVGTATGPAKGNAQPSKTNASRGPSKDLKSLGKYRILKPLGAGGMGTVYLAEDSELKRTVALKVLPKEKAENPVLVRRFRSEGQAAAVLEHNHIVKVYEAGALEGHLYMALEYVEGIDVHALVQKKGFIPIRRSIDIVRQVTEALVHAQTKNIVHRDIKPSNLLIKRDGTVKLADMGLARSVDEETETNITRAGTTVGTVDYMAPEQARDSKAADIRSDIYSLGCTWYHMLTGQPPYHEGSLTNKLQAHATGPLPDPREFNEDVPEVVVAVIHRMMAKSPGDRYQSPGELLADLKKAASSEIVIAATLLEEEEDDSTANTTARQTKSKRRKSKAAAAAAAPATADVVDIDPEASDDSVPAEESKKSFRAKKAKDRKRSKAAKRGESTQEESDASSGGQKSFAPKRDLPPKDAPAIDASAGFSVDLNLIKYAVIAGGALAIGFLVFRAILSASSAFEDFGTDVANPYGTKPQAEEEPPVADPVDREEPADEPDDAIQSVVDAVDPNDAGNSAVDAGGVPAWVSALRTQEAVAQLERRIVTRRPSGANQFGSLNEALADLPPKGAVIEVSGQGPFAIQPTTISNCRRLVLQGNKEQPPILEVVAVGDARPAVIALTDGALELQDLHFVVREDAGRTPSIIADVQGGNVSVRHCSFLKFAGADELVAVRNRASGGRAQSGDDGQVLFDRVLCGGPGIAALHIERPDCSVVIENSVLIGEGVPLIAVAFQEQSTRKGMLQEQEEIEQEPSVLQFRNSMLLADTSILQLIGGEALGGLLRISAHDSVLAARGKQTEAPLVAIQNWPAAEAARLDSSQAPHVDFRLDDSLLAGWSQLVRMTDRGGNVTTVPDVGAWRRFWREGVSSRAVIEQAAPADATAASPEPARRWLEELRADHGSDLGADFAHLARPSVGIIERMLALSKRPRIPADFADGIPGETVIEYDLTKRKNLDRFVSSDQCPDGAHVIATGGGAVTLGPIVITGKSVRLEFRSVDKPLILQPAALTGTDAKAGDSALFSVTGGRLDLIGARVNVPSSRTRSYPRWVLAADDADLLLRNCRLEGPFTADVAHSGLISWKTNARNRRHAMIVDSFLAGRQAVSADLTNGLLLMHNTVLAATETAIVATTLEQASQPASLQLSYVTCSAAEAALRVSGRAPIQVLTKSTVFAPPLLDDRSATVLLRMGDVQVQWWGDKNGYAGAIKEFLKQPGGRSDVTSLDAWEAHWGEGHELRALSGPTGVLLARALPEPRDLEAGHFELAEGSEAASWDDRNQPIGAKVATLGPEVPEREEPAAQTGTANRRRSAPRRSPVNPGF